MKPMLDEAQQELKVPDSKIARMYQKILSAATQASSLSKNFEPFF